MPTLPRYELQLFNQPSYHFLQDHNEYPDDRHYRRHRTLLLTLRVRFSRPQPDYAQCVVYYVRKYSEPLAVMTRSRHSALARDKLSRMLREARVPLAACRRDFVAKLLRDVRILAASADRTLHVLRASLSLDTTVLYLPDLSESDPDPLDTRNRPPVYLDGPRSRNYHDYYYNGYNGDHDDVIRPIFMREVLNDDLDRSGGSWPEEFIAYDFRNGASERSIAGLEKVNVGGEELATDCPICFEDIPAGSEATRLPCSHYYHGGCIGTWLQKSRACPLCRFQLPS